MGLKYQGVAVGLIVVTLATLFMPVTVLASQDSKNTWRNLAIGSAVVGAAGLAKGNKTVAAVGLAGAAYSASRYEQDRKHQSQAQARARRLRYLRHRHAHHH